MKLSLAKSNKRELVFIAVVGLLCVGLALIKNPALLAKPAGHSVTAKVLTVDDSALTRQGLVLYGSQSLQVEITGGKFAGEIFTAANILRGQMELDKVFVSGDRITVAVDDAVIPGKTVLTAKDYQRSVWIWVLFGLFCILLIVFGSWVGVKALFSFLFSCLVIFKAVIPLCLHGYPAGLVILICVAVLTAVIIFLVAGVTRKGLAAFLGALAGVAAGFVMAHLFGWLLHIDGTSLPYVQTLFYSGYESLNMSDIFIGALVLASSGAMMDLAMDIASAVDELARHNPQLSSHQLVLSGLRIGRSVVGTMTTTLLLAYSGGFMTLLMMFFAQQTPVMDVLNNPLVASEAVKTLIGSFSLVLVAPLTALTSGVILKYSRKNNIKI